MLQQTDVPHMRRQVGRSRSLLVSLRVEAGEGCARRADGVEVRRKDAQAGVKNGKMGDLDMVLNLLSRMSEHERRRGNSEAMYAHNRAWHAVHELRAAHAADQAANDERVEERLER